MVCRGGSAAERRVPANNGRLITKIFWFTSQSGAALQQRAARNVTGRRSLRYGPSPSLLPALLFSTPNPHSQKLNLERERAISSARHFGVSAPISPICLRAVLMLGRGGAGRREAESFRPLLHNAAVRLKAHARLLDQSLEDPLPFLLGCQTVRYSLGTTG